MRGAPTCHTPHVTRSRSMVGRCANPAQPPANLAQKSARCRGGISQYWSNCLARAALIARRRPRNSVAHQADDKRIKYLRNYSILESRMWAAPGQAGEAAWHGYFSN